MKNNKILTYAQVKKTINTLQKQNRSIIFAHGVFDLLHKGHVTLLKAAKKYGDVLIVGVETNVNTKQIKGSDRPIHHHDARIFVLSELASVDFAFLIPNYPKNVNQNLFYQKLYNELKPNVVVTCVKAGKHGMLKKQHAKEINAKFVDVSSRYELNTSKIIEQIKSKILHEKN